jgi:phosphate transport system protein
MLQNFEDQLNTLNQQVIDIAKSILRANQIILDAFEECDSVILAGAKSDLKNINYRTNDIDNEIIKLLALFTPEAKDLRLIVSFFKFTNELQRASSNTKSFIKTFELYCTNIDKDSIKNYAIPLQKATVESLEAIVELLESEEDDARDYFNKVLIAENKTDEIYDNFQDFILQKDKNIEDFSKFTKILNALRKSEKIADRSVDMAYLLLFAKLGGSLGDVEV